MEVCVALTTPPFIALLGALSRLRGTRLVLWSMDLYPEVPVACGYIRKGSFLHRLLAAASRFLYRRSSRIISLGEVMTRRLLEAGAPAEKIVTVHNWVPAEAVHPLPPEQSRARRKWQVSAEPALMYSGNLGMGHELDTVVRAAAQLQGRTPLQLLFVGGGKMRDPLRNLVAELQLDCVHFHPSQPLDALSDTLAAGDIHLVAQKPGMEGLIVPSKIYGVLAAGRPVLFIGPTDCEPAHIVQSSGAGVIVPPGDAQKAAEALLLLTSSAEMRREMGEKARKYYEEHFGRARSVGKILQAL
jgi:glycosyltransferase involved in cell wall biosynthesis